MFGASSSTLADPLRGGGVPTEGAGVKSGSRPLGGWSAKSVSQCLTGRKREGCWSVGRPACFVRVTSSLLLWPGPYTHVQQNSRNKV